MRVDGGGFEMIGEGGRGGRPGFYENGKQGVGFVEFGLD